MPTISQFFGIIIQMFWREHAPPHFHAMYGYVVLHYGHHRSWQCGSFLPGDRLHKNSYTLPNQLFAVSAGGHDKPTAASSSSARNKAR